MVGEGLRGVVWIWVMLAKSARCTVKMCGGRRRVGGGPWGWGWENVDCSAKCDMECTMVTSGGDM